MRRFLRVTLLVLTIACFMAALVWSGYCWLYYRQLAHATDVSGIDFLMAGVGCGIGLAAIGIAGAVCALFHSRLTFSRNMQLFDLIAAGLFFLLVVCAFILMFV